MQESGFVCVILQDFASASRLPQYAGDTHVPISHIHMCQSRPKILIEKNCTNVCHFHIPPAIVITLQHFTFVQQQIKNYKAHNYILTKHDSVLSYIPTVLLDLEIGELVDLAVGGSL